MSIGGVVVPCPACFGLNGDGGYGTIECSRREWFAGNGQYGGTKVVVAVAVGQGDGIPRGALEANMCQRICGEHVYSADLTHGNGEWLLGIDGDGEVGWGSVGWAPIINPQGETGHGLQAAGDISRRTAALIEVSVSGFAGIPAMLEETTRCGN